MSLDLKQLIAKLNDTTRAGMEEAAQLCVAQTHYDVEIEHLLVKLIEKPETDLQLLLRHYEIDRSVLARQLMSTIDGLKRGNPRMPAFSPHLIGLLEDAWMQTSLLLQGTRTRTAALLLALLENRSLTHIVDGTVLASIQVDRLRREIGDLLIHSREEGDPGSVSRSAGPVSVPAGAAGPSPGASPSAADRSRAAARPGSATPSLDQYCIDLTAEARAGRIDEIVGRDREIRQMIDILTRRRQNNPILVGEAGVGKTAVVEGLALRIARGQVPPALRGVSIKSLDIGLLQAGAGVRGEFENRLKSLIAEVKAALKPIVLFIDEAHSLIGAGGPQGQGDAANLIKPALARGELRTIAATTWSEYKKYFEKDAALTRRFQTVDIDEPSEANAILMLRAVAPHFEAHHDVRILDEAVRQAVVLTHRYVTGRWLPDKAIAVLDTACARVTLGQNATPPQIEGLMRRIEDASRELTILERESARGRDHAVRIEALLEERESATTERARLETRWQAELELVRAILAERRALEAGEAQAQARTRLDGLETQLAALQGETPMVPLAVDAHVVADVVAAWTGIPLGAMLKGDIEKVLELEGELAARIIGQDHALEVISRRIRAARADLVDPGKPLGVFLLAGPSGVGKTETAVALAELLYGGERNMIVINMSEFQEPHSVSSLKGAPPGYVGYGSGGVLTEAVRRAPFSVVLLDEVEKAHSDVLEVFYQVFDKGIMEDGEGVPVNFKNCLILMTSNLAGDAIQAFCENAGTYALAADDHRRLAEMVRDLLGRHFHPAFLGRLTQVPYLPLGDAQLARIVTLKLDKIARRFQVRHDASLTYAPEIATAIAARCTEVQSGARNIDHILSGSLIPEMSLTVLESLARGQRFSAIHVELNRDGGFQFRVQRPDQPDPPIAVEPAP